MPARADDVRRALRRVASPARAANVARFFKTGKGQYGEGDVFIGCTVPEQRRIARRFRELPLTEVETLLTSKIHEERLTALLILVDRFTRATDEAVRGRIYRLYLRRLPHVNNWDLVDASAEYIVGGWLADKDRAVLDRLARSRHLWTRRVAMLATFHYIKQGSAEDALRVAEALLGDAHDLIHKAVGWMLREVGKRVSPAALRSFLKVHAGAMPRTALRYAIEHFPAAERARWMAGG
ncbi:MAG TPA: DNA alkylation repair protein [Steroidobacteraceae bacterium]|jgi:3-methyladenine DNA glycosylase AlkD|nr:DNA alkylation repair protein [Steroidobacteraceae bacterium]